MRGLLSRAALARAGGVAGLGLLTIVTYCVQLGRNGLGNPFYAAAVQAGSRSAHDAFFAAIDFSGTMSVDKPPLSLWLMEVSVRIFGLTPFGELLPDALAGVATTAVVVLAVREWTSLHWGLFAGLVSLASPMAAVMFRFNNPEALLTLLVTAAVWCFTSALRTPSTWKLVLAGLLVGGAILTKLLAGVVVVPVLLVAYALWSPRRPLIRALQLTLFVVTAVASSAWYFVVVALTPAGQRPWVDGTTNDSPFSLLFASNVGRLVSKAGKGLSSSPGLLRMFHHEELANYGPQIVTALLAVVALTVAVRTADRGGRRAGLVLIGTGLWLCLVMSFVQGGYHSYYAVVATPALAAGTAVSLALIWRDATAQARRLWLLLVAVVTASFSVWVWAHYAGPIGVAIWAASGIALLALLGLRWPRSVLAAALATVLLLPGYYTWLSWHDPHAGGSPAGGPVAMQPAWDQNPPTPDDFNFPSRVSPDLRFLLQHAGPYEYAVAMQRDEEAGSVQLATDVTVLPLTGWNRPPPGMFDQFRRLVGERAVRYFLPTGPRTRIVRWVEEHFRRFWVGDQSVYDLISTRPHHRSHHHEAHLLLKRA